MEAERGAQGFAVGVDLASFVGKIQSLKRFAVLNALAVVKITKKHDKYATEHEKIQEALMHNVRAMSFCSSARFSELMRTTAVLTQRTNGVLTASHDASETASTASFCPPSRAESADPMQAGACMASMGGSVLEDVSSHLRAERDTVAEESSKDSSSQPARIGLEFLADAAIKALSFESDLSPLPPCDAATDRQRGTKRRAPHGLDMGRYDVLARRSSSSSGSMASTKLLALSSRDADDTPTLEVKPRLRRRSYGLGGRQSLGGRPHLNDNASVVPIQVTAQVLQQHFTMPLNDAARHLGICATAIKKVCRKMGIRQWPFQRLKPIESRLCKLKKKLKKMARPAPDMAAEIEGLEARKQALLLGLDPDDR